MTDLIEAARYADIILFVAPHSRIPDFCRTLLGKIKPDALAITMSNSFVPDEEGVMQLPSHSVMKHLKVRTYVCICVLGALKLERDNKMSSVPLIVLVCI